MENIPVTKTFHHTTYPAIDPTSPANSAAGKTVAVTGGAGGIGYAISRGFCKAGADTVILLARRQHVLSEAAAKLHAEFGTTVWTYTVDIRDAASTSATFASIRKRLSEDSGEEEDVDVLVVNAATLHQGENVIEYEPEIVRDSFETNTIGNINVVRAFLTPEIPAIPKTPFLSGITFGKKKEIAGVKAPGRQKVILEVSSVSTHILFPEQSLYSASKLASTHIFRFLQTEIDKLPGSPVRIHSFHPGAIRTPGLADVTGEADMNSFEWDDPSLPEGFAVWLSTPAAAFLKGRLVYANWDVEELIAMKKKFEEDPEYLTITLKC